VQVFDYPILSVVPVIYFQLWVTEGREGVQKFLRKVLKYFALLAIPFAFCFVAVSNEVVEIIASPKFAEAATIIPYVVVGGIVFTSSTFFSAGLYIHKKSTLPACIMVISAMINLGLNVALVPKYGIIGAAVATLIAYTCYVIIIIPAAFKYISYTPEYAVLGRALLYGVGMATVTKQISVENVWGSLLAKGGAAVFIYLVMVFAFERELREKGMNYLRKVLT